MNSVLGDLNAYVVGGAPVVVFGTAVLTGRCGLGGLEFVSRTEGAPNKINISSSEGGKCRMESDSGWVIDFACEGEWWLETDGVGEGDIPEPPFYCIYGQGRRNEVRVYPYGD